MSGPSRRIATIFILMVVCSGASIARADEASAPPEAQNPPAAPSAALAALGSQAADDWEMVPGAGAFASAAIGAANELTVAGGPLVLVSKQSRSGPRSLRLRVRLRTSAPTYAKALVALAGPDEKTRGLFMTLWATPGTDVVHCACQQGDQDLHDLKALEKGLNWSAAYINNAFDYHLHAYTQYLPGWPEDFRARIEADMATIPALEDKWLAVRVDVRSGAVWFWVDDRLVAWKQDASISAQGFDRIELTAGIEVTGLEVRPLVETPGFLPLALTGQVNAKALLGGASVARSELPEPGEMRTLGGVPFLSAGPNPGGNDHLDIGRSFCRDANTEGYVSHYEGVTLRDPVRIRFRIPNGQYDALYLIAAADGRPDSVPTVTAAFYRPTAGFPESFAADVPLATATSSDAAALPITLTNGKQANLWLVKIPLDPGRLSSLADCDVIEMELTKKLAHFRLYPDPANYTFEPGGLPSSVHVYAATLGRVPVGLTLEPDRFAHVWTAPEVPAYSVALTNHTGLPQTAELTVFARSYDGAEESRQHQTIELPEAIDRTTVAHFQVPVRCNGYHNIAVTLRVAGRTWVERRSFVRLAPDTRSPRWTEGKGALFGFWSYGTAHYGPKFELTRTLMTQAGSRTGLNGYFDKRNNNQNDPQVLAHWTHIEGTYFGLPQPWAKTAGPNDKVWQDYQKECLSAIAQFDSGIPAPFRPDVVAMFGESVISNRLTSGNYPEYWNGQPYQYNEVEDDRIAMHVGVIRCLSSAIRRARPDLKIMIEWGDPLFIVPLLRAGVNKDLVDGTALDNAGFERLPEMQLHHVSLHRLYELKKEYAKAGIADPDLRYFEGPFFPTEPGVLSWREQMDIQDRFTLISMAYGVKHFYSGWYDFDSGDWYGDEHYGGCGIFRRIPYCDPKPAYAAFATMTDRLNEANFDSWLKTGSLTTYCLRFTAPRGNVYTLWTVRGRRRAVLTLDRDATVELTDTMNNTTRLVTHDGRVTVPISTTVAYVTTGAAKIAGIGLMAPDHSDAQPPERDSIQVADLGDGSWSFDSRPNPTFERNTFAVEPYVGHFTATVVQDPQHGRVLASTLGKQAAVHELMPWYSTLVPAHPIVLKGAPAHIGIWVKGASDWGRVIYVLRDFRGERWISIGSKDQWNCDDLHSAASINFDGWRFVRFEMPGHLGYDNFRRLGTTWWGHYPSLGSHTSGGAGGGTSGGGGDDGVVDLPLSLEGIIVEQRTHIIYVNDVQPVASDTVLLGKLYAEYDKPEDATDEAVRLSRLRMPLPSTVPDIANPIAQAQKSGVAPATEILRLEPPLAMADGTNVKVLFKEVPGAQKYFVWVSAHPDGRGAANMTPSGATSGQLVVDLRAEMKLYYWITYVDAQGRPSKPSSAHEEVLHDMFKER